MNYSIRGVKVNELFLRSPLHVGQMINSCRPLHFLKHERPDLIFFFTTTFFFQIIFLTTRYTKKIQENIHREHDKFTLESRIKYQKNFLPRQSVDYFFSTIGFCFNFANRKFLQIIIQRDLLSKRQKIAHSCKANILQNEAEVVAEEINSTFVLFCFYIIWQIGTIFITQSQIYICFDRNKIKWKVFWKAKKSEPVL